MSREEIVELAEGRFGILTQAAQGLPLRPAVVLFNVGLVHRVGPFRQQVQLARRLAALGHPVLRFDMPGIGESAFSASSEFDVISDVFNRLDQHLGAHGYIIGGICAAADRGWNISLADPRVRGLLLIDAVARPGRSFRRGQAKLFLARPKTDWSGMVLRRILPGKKEPGEEHFRDWPEAGTEPAEMQEILGKDIRVLAIYTGGIAHYFLDPGQFRETFGKAVDDPRVDFEFWPDCDHLIMSRNDRLHLHGRIADWCQLIKPLSSNPASSAQAL
ncbi:MAG: hypothetical protein WBP11_01390 [Dokdonella sp.]